MLITFNAKANRTSGFLSSLGLLFKRGFNYCFRQIAYKISFEEFCNMASYLNMLSVKLCSGSEKLMLIKSYSRLVNESQLEGSDRISYRVLTATTHHLESSDDGRQKQLKLDRELVEMFQLLNREDQLDVFSLCAEYGRSDIEWVSSVIKPFSKADSQKALGLAAEKGQLKVLKFYTLVLV